MWRWCTLSGVEVGGAGKHKQQDCLTKPDQTHLSPSKTWTPTSDVSTHTWLFYTHFKHTHTPHIPTPTHHHPNIPHPNILPPTHPHTHTHTSSPTHPPTHTSPHPHIITHTSSHPHSTLTAIPYRSVEAEAAVGEELATVVVLVSKM